MADDAVSGVINTPELLESILVRVDAKTLLLSQRVNKTFNATIAGSIILQQELCFRATPDDESKSADSCDIGVNELFRWPFTPNRGSRPARIYVASPLGTIVLDSAKASRAAGEALRRGSWQRMLVAKSPKPNQPMEIHRLETGSRRSRRVLRNPMMTLGEILNIHWPEEGASHGPG